MTSSTKPVVRLLGGLAGEIPAKSPNRTARLVVDDVMDHLSQDSEPNRPQRTSKPANGRMSALP